MGVRVSTEWGVHCKTCDSSTIQGFNHGQAVVRSLIKAAPHIKAALAVDESGLLSFDVMGYRWSDIVDFVLEHTGHELELESEYGDTEPLKEHKYD